MVSASPRFRLYLLGTCRIERDDGVIHLPTHKDEWLLAYLVLFPAPQPREKLAFLFWGDSPDAEARASLRTALAVLRKRLATDIILTDRETVQLNPTITWWVDAREFFKLDRLIQTNLSLLSSSQIDFPATVQLYGGDLLPGCYADWIASERERLRALYLEALTFWIAQLRAQSDYAQMVLYAQKILALEPANEAAHTSLMFAYVTQGDRAAALRQYETCKQALWIELGVKPSTETESLAQRIKRASGSARIPTASLSNLLIPLTSFVGREKELAEVKRLLIGDSSGVGVRLLTLTGAAGCGKTRLAIQVANDLLATGEFTDGVWWSELSQLADPALVPHAIANVLGLRELTVESITDALARYLRDKQLLLLLDGCDHVLGACTDLATKLLTVCPRVTMLVTSREAFGLPGEAVWKINGLSLPQTSASLPLALIDYLKADAVRLFVERASALVANFQLTLANGDAITQICQRLDGIPLALELAAARCASLPVETLAARLNDRFYLLTGGSGRLPQHQTLTAALDWSYEQLTESQRAALRRLSVFIGGWSLEAAEAVLGAAGQPRILDLLAQLVAKSLVMFEPEDSTARYWMLETIREYARDKLIAAGEAVGLRDLHRDWCLDFAETGEVKLRRAEQTVWLARFEHEHDNLRAALRWSLHRANTTPHDLEAGMRLAGTLRQFWTIRGYLSEGRAWCAKALDNPMADSIHLSIRAKVLNSAGVLAYFQGDLRGAAELAEASLTLARATKDTWLCAIALFILGEFERNAHNNLVRAGELTQESLLLARQIGDDWLIALALVNLGLQARQQGDHVRATECFEESLSMCRQVGDQWIVAVLLDQLGSQAYWQGDCIRAAFMCEQGLDVRRALKDKNGIAGSLNDLGQIARCQGEMARAYTFFSESLALFRELDQRESIAIVQRNLAFVLLDHGELAEATEAWRSSLAAMYALGKREGIADSLAGLACAACAAKSFARAARLFGAAAGLRDTIRAQIAPADRADYERDIAASRAALGVEASATIEATGRALSVEQAVAEALGN